MEVWQKLTTWSLSWQVTGGGVDLVPKCIRRRASPIRGRVSPRIATPDVLAVDWRRSGMAACDGPLGASGGRWLAGRWASAPGDCTPVVVRSAHVVGSWELDQLSRRSREQELVLVAVVEMATESGRGNEVAA